MSPDEQLGDLLLTSIEIGEDDLYRALADQMGVLYVRLGDFDVDPSRWRRWRRWRPSLRVRIVCCR